MRKATIMYHLGGLQKIIKALGAHKGDPYDAAVASIKAAKKAGAKSAKKKTASK